MYSRYFVSMFNLHIDQSQLLAGWYKQFPCLKNKKMTIDGHWTAIFCPKALVATGEIILHLQLNTTKYLDRVSNFTTTQQ